MQRASISRSSLSARFATVALIGLPHMLLAHTNPVPIREIVRIRGTIARPESPCAEKEVSLRVLGKTVRLCGSDVRRIAVAASAKPGEEEVPAVSYELQGDRGVLAQASGAAADSRLTILAEWRPGRRDLFLIDLDVCECAPTVSNPASGPGLGSTDVNR